MKIERRFLTVGEHASADHKVSVEFRVEAEGREPLRIRQKISHPPIHLGCDCSIVPA